MIKPFLLVRYSYSAKLHQFRSIQLILVHSDILLKMSRHAFSHISDKKAGSVREACGFLWRENTSPTRQVNTDQPSARRFYSLMAPWSDLPVSCTRSIGTQPGTQVRTMKPASNMRPSLIFKLRRKCKSFKKSHLVIEL